jgi:hypothetical protein
MVVSMSATVYWRPVQPKDGHALDGQSGFFAMLQRTFGGASPVVIIERGGDEQILRGMADASEPYRSSFIALADALEHHESIEVWAEY